METADAGLRRRLLSSVAVLLLAGGCAQATLVSVTTEIPRRSYKSWSMFLVCNSTWLRQTKNEDLRDLYDQYQRFGRAIGDDHVAVWFWRRTTRWNDPKLADNLDVERSVRFCSTFGLRPSESPHVLVTNTYPDLANPPKEYAVLALGNMSPRDTEAVLLKLTDSLVLTGKPGAPTTQSAYSATPLWQRLLDSVQQTMAGVVCAATLKVQSAFLTAEFHGCRQK